MNGHQVSGNASRGQLSQTGLPATLPDGTSLFWPADRRLFRRRRAPASRLAAGVAMTLLASASLLATWKFVFD